MSRVRPVEDARVASLQAVAEGVFATMVDGEGGTLRRLAGAAPARPLRAWVDIAGTYPVRVVLALGDGTAARLAGAFAGCDPAELDEEEVADAVGEVANMLGGNLKSMLPPGGVLGLPEVGREGPGGEPLYDVALDWRGEPIVVSVLAL